MIDYAEALLHAQKNVKKLEEHLRNKEHHKAFDDIIDAEAELMKLKNWVNKKMRD